MRRSTYLAFNAAVLITAMATLPALAGHSNINTNTTATVSSKLNFQQEIQKIMSVISHVNLSAVDKAAIETFKDIQQFKAKYYMGNKEANASDAAMDVSSPAKAPATMSRDAF